MTYKITLEISEKDMREKLRANGWVLMDPGCTRLYNDGTSVYTPPQKCYWFNNKKEVRNVLEIWHNLTRNESSESS